MVTIVGKELELLSENLERNSVSRDTDALEKKYGLIWYLLSIDK